MHLNWRWKTGSRQRVIGNGNFKIKMLVKANQNIPFPPTPTFPLNVLLSKVYTLWIWPKSECCQTKPALNIFYKLCFPSACLASLLFPRLCISVYSWGYWDPEKERDFLKVTQRMSVWVQTRAKALTQAHKQHWSGSRACVSTWVPAVEDLEVGKLFWIIWV